MTSGSQCCGKCFKFDFEGLENVKFHAADGGIILLTYTKDNSIHHAISFDCGRTFVGRQRIMDIEGQVKQIEVLAKDNQFVVAAISTVPGKDIKRAVSGKIDRQNNSYSHKECIRHEKKRILNISLGFRPYVKEGEEASKGGEESVDYVFYENEKGEICIECHGHGPCKIV